MSGHSHWAGIKHKKQAEDQKRGKIFSKLSRMISVAAREGADPEMNPKLRQALEEAKAFNMPKENIERAIKRGTGELEGAKLEEVSYEAFGPGGVAIIIEGITDNKNRTFQEVKQILQKYSGKLAESGAVKWLFVRKGVITINPNIQNSMSKEDLELKAIEAGAEDIYWHKTEDLLDIYTKPEELDKVKKNLEAQGIKIESVSLDWVPKDPIEVNDKDREELTKLFEELDENDAVQNIYSTLEI
ncbi:MAG: YebC/PmpR family DNA-binding transcriptional regulator [Candidatus Nealsonbacteria bacterium]|nr:MAG: YebC/PmpR family DNA-binding transcriptional regulator [Candidatus Nealsonbacteria bacterium]